MILSVPVEVLLVELGRSHVAVEFGADNCGGILERHQPVRCSDENLSVHRLHAISILERFTIHQIVGVRSNFVHLVRVRVDQVRVRLRTVRVLMEDVDLPPGVGELVIRRLKQAAVRGAA